MNPFCARTLERCHHRSLKTAHEATDQRFAPYSQAVCAPEKWALFDADVMTEH